MPVPDRTECEEIVSRLWPFLDGALPDTDRDRVVSHLAGCTGCRSHYDFARAFLDVVRREAPLDDAARFASLRARVERALLRAGAGDGA